MILLALPLLILGGGINDSCLPDDIECFVSENGASIIIGGERPGDPGNGIAPPSDEDGSFVGGGAPGVVGGDPGVPGGSAAPVVTLCNTEDDTWDRNNPLIGFCLPPDDPGEDPVEIPYPTIYDLASFSPHVPSLVSEPAAAGILGKPTNFLSTADTHVLVGSLFGYPVSVRFAPVQYTFEYGDGTSKTVADASDSWEAGGLPQFTPTEASHSYSIKGNVEVAVRVGYSAEVNFTGSSAWLPVEGLVSAQASGYQVTIYEAITALVDKDCFEDPNGIGCP